MKTQKFSQHLLKLEQALKERDVENVFNLANQLVQNLSTHYGILPSAAHLHLNSNGASSSSSTPVCLSTSSYTTSRALTAYAASSVEDKHLRAEILFRLGGIVDLAANKLFSRADKKALDKIPLEYKIYSILAHMGLEHPMLDMYIYSLEDLDQITPQLLKSESFNVVLSVRGFLVHLGHISTYSRHSTIQISIPLQGVEFIVELTETGLSSKIDELANTCRQLKKVAESFNSESLWSLEEKYDALLAIIYLLEEFKKQLKPEN